MANKVREGEEVLFHELAIGLWRTEQPNSTEELKVVRTAYEDVFDVWILKSTFSPEVSYYRCLIKSKPDNPQDVTSVCSNHFVHPVTHIVQDLKVKGECIVAFWTQDYSALSYGEDGLPRTADVLPVQTCLQIKFCSHTHAESFKRTYNASQKAMELTNLTTKAYWGSII